MKKNVFVVDDHAAIREGFKAILERSPDWVVGGEAASAEELLDKLSGGGLSPDLFLVDVSLPGMNGIELVAALRKITKAPTVILSMHRRYDYIAQALKAGASGYVAKDAGVECIVQALSAAWQGGCYLDPASLRLFVDEVLAGTAARPLEPKASFPPLSEAGLSEREEEVLRLLSSGRRADEIASLLGLSRKTVENHLSNITVKLGAHSRFELYRIAALRGRE